MSSGLFFTQLINGLSMGALLFFLASGFTLIFGLMRIVNLAHGSFYLLGGYAGFTTAAVTGNLWLAILAGTAVAGVIGLTTERMLLRHVRGDANAEVLVTIGVTFILADVALAIWGGNPRTVDVPEYLSGPLRLGDFFYPRYRIFIIVLAILMAIGLYLLQNRTRVGAVVRAGVDDREMVSAMGININRVFTGVFIFGACLAGFAGVIGGGLLSLLPGGEFEILLLSLVVVIIGGLGSLSGAVIGSLLVGLIDAFGRAFVPDLSYFTLFGPMALVLVLWPRGLFGKES